MVHDIPEIGGGEDEDDKTVDEVDDKGLEESESTTVPSSSSGWWNCCWFAGKNICTTTDLHSETCQKEDCETFILQYWSKSVYSKTGSRWNHKWKQVLEMSDDSDTDKHEVKHLIVERIMQGFTALNSTNITL